MKIKASHVFYILFSLTIFKGVIDNISTTIVDYFVFFLSLILYFLIFKNLTIRRLNNLGSKLFIFTLLSLIFSLFISESYPQIITEWYTDIRFLPLFILPIMLNKTNFNYEKFNKYLYKIALIHSLFIIAQFIFYKFGFQIDIAQKEIIDSLSGEIKLIEGKIGSQTGIFSRTVEASYFILLVFLNTLFNKKYKTHELLILGLGIFLTFKRLPFLIFSASVFIFVLRNIKIKVFFSIIILASILIYDGQEVDGSAKRTEFDPISLLKDVFSPSYWEKSSNTSRLLILGTFADNVVFKDVLIGRGLNILNDIDEYADDIDAEFISQKISIIRDVEVISISLKYGLIFCLIYIIYLRNKIYKYYNLKNFKFYRFYFFMVFVSLFTIRFFNVGIISLLFWYYLGFRHIENEKLFKPSS